MDAVHWLLAANVVVWIGLGSYTAFLSLRSQALSRALKRRTRSTHA